MELRFATAGYREKNKYNFNDNSGGGNILIITETGVGDFVLSTGAIREIRRIYPTARITLLVRSSSLILAEACPYVNEVIVDSQGFNPVNPFEFYKLHFQTASRLLEQRFDICFALALHPKTFLLMYMSGSKVRITSIKDETWEAFNQRGGQAEYFMRLATHLFPYSNYGVHMADRFLSLLESMLHLPITNRKTEVWYTPADIGAAKTLLKEASAPIYALCMGGSTQRKHYPPEKYARFLEMILEEEPTATFVILGGGKEDLNSTEIIKSVAPEIYEKNIIDLTNKINYRQSAAVLSFCKMYIGNDTGTMHVAAALSTPVLSVNCFAYDLPASHYDIPHHFYPYGVLSVVVQPKQALPECKGLKFYDFYGCVATFPHCIAQIEPQMLLKGFHLLKERVTAKINEPLFIH